MGFSLVGIDGKDIADGNKTLTLGKCVLIEIAEVQSLRSVVHAHVKNSGQGQDQTDTYP
jgi:hypothetical protein